MDVRPDKEILIGERFFDVVYHHSAGIIRSKFLTELRDNKRIVGTKCPECDMVWVPARSTCLHCFSKLDEFAEVSDTGTITTFSVVHTTEYYCPVKTPFVLAVIQLEGADTGIVHYIGGIDPEDVKTGMKVQAVFNEERSGSILDIKYFKPVEG